MSVERTQSDYEAIARFLMTPFLDKPEVLKFHSETLAGGKKLWLRAAFDEAEDKGRVFGRGGRNIKAVRTVIAATAKLSEMTVNLSVFGEPEPERSERGDRSSGGRGDRSGGSSGGSYGSSRRQGSDRTRESRPPRPSTNPAPPKKKPKSE
ncbi:MAG: KH domain-containing protein [Phormidesmis sp.]